MAGVKLKKFLDMRTFVSKVLGMVSMLATGMSLGKEGPFVHITACLAHNISFRYKELLINRSLYHEFMTAAIAVGVTATFGAPIGGVLFAIEVSSSSFSVSNLWKSYFAATITVLCFKAADTLGNGAALFTAEAS